MLHSSPSKVNLTRSSNIHIVKFVPKLFGWPGPPFNSIQIYSVTKYQIAVLSYNFYIVLAQLVAIKKKVNYYLLDRPYLTWTQDPLRHPALLSPMLNRLHQSLDCGHKYCLEMKMSCKIIIHQFEILYQTIKSKKHTCLGITR